MTRTRWLAAMSLVMMLCCVAVASEKERPIGDAWSDSRNPVVTRFKGKRLYLWSLRQPFRTQPSVVREPARVRNPIDQFLLAQLDKKGLSLSLEADRKTLIRRLTFGLTGLPPSPEEV